VLEPRFGNRRLLGHRDAAQRQALVGGEKGGWLHTGVIGWNRKRGTFPCRDREARAINSVLRVIINADEPRERDNSPLREEIPRRERRANGRESSSFSFFFSFLTPRISSGEFPSSNLLSSALSITYLEDLCRRNRDGTCLRQIEFSIASQFSRLLVDWRNERNLQLSYFISLGQVLGLEKSRKQAPLTMPIQDTWSSFYIIISFPRDCLLNFSYY